MSTRSVRILMLIQMNYHQYLENYTLKKIEDIDCQKTIKDINFTDLKNLFFRTRTKKYDYFVIMHSSLKNRAGVLSLMHWNKRSSEQERRVDALALRAEERRDKLRKAAGRCMMQAFYHHSENLHTL